MIDLALPPLDVPAPAIIRPVADGLWGSRDAELKALGLPRHVRRAILHELRRLIGESEPLIRATAADLARYAGEPALMGLLPGMVPVIDSGLRLFWLGLATSDADAQTYNWGNFAAPCAGLMIVGTWARTPTGSNQTVSSVSIGGSNGAIHINPSGGEDPICLASRVISAGNNAVSSTFTASRSRAAAAVWLLARYQSATPIATDGRNDSVNRASQTATISTTIGGVAIFLNWVNSAAGTWNNGVIDATTPVTIEGGSTIQPAHRMRTPTATNTNYTCTWGGSIASGIVGGSWR